MPGNRYTYTICIGNDVIYSKGGTIMQNIFSSHEGGGALQNIIEKH